MTIWFDGSEDIASTIPDIGSSLDNHGEHYVGITRLMPGLTSVELIDQGRDFVTIQTNEGLMTRTSITKRIEAASVMVEFDEEYRANRMVSVTSHHSEEYTTVDTGVRCRIVLSDVESPGFLGFFYRTFGRSNIGNTLLRSTKGYFEKTS